VGGLEEGECGPWGQYPCQIFPAVLELLSSVLAKRDFVPVTAGGVYLACEGEFRREKRRACRACVGAVPVVRVNTGLFTVIEGGKVWGPPGVLVKEDNELWFHVDVFR
jgi:hypothetical protein